MKDFRSPEAEFKFIFPVRYAYSVLFMGIWGVFKL